MHRPRACSAASTCSEARHERRRTAGHAARRERGRLIDNGKLGAVVKNPGYRGISASFWRSLAKVGDAATLQVLGTPYCGKGEPSQIIRCGHASPACMFTGVDVFGGAQ